MEASGCEVYPYNPEDHPNSLDLTKLEPIKTKKGLTEGMTILVPGFGGGHYLMDVYKDGADLYAKGKSLIGVLEYEDGVWVCGGFVNTRALQKL